MGCQSGLWFKKSWGLFAAGSFWKLVALWHPQPSVGPCSCIASHYPELSRIVFGNRMLTFSYGANLQVGPSSSLPVDDDEQARTFSYTVVATATYSTFSLVNCVTRRLLFGSFFQGLTLAVRAKPPHALNGPWVETHLWGISAVFSYQMSSRRKKKLRQILLCPMF